MNAESYNDVRVPPSAVDIEAGLLGALLTSDENVILAVETEIGSTPDIFFRPAHQSIYRSILRLRDKGISPDILTVENDLRDHGQLELVGGGEALAELTRNPAAGHKADQLCQILIEKWTKRTLIASVSNLMKDLYDSTTDPHDILDQAMSSFDVVLNKLYRKQGVFVSDMLKDVLDHIQLRREKPGISGVASGYAIDKYTGGWQPGDLYIIAARPSIGKTALALNAAFNAALFASEKYRTVVHYTNMEMKNRDLIQRRLALESQVNFTKMRDGNISDGEFSRLLDAAGTLFETRFMLDDTASMHINEWRAKIKAAVRRHGVGLAVVDYLQLMSGRSEGTREQEISTISRGLKAGAKECNIPVIALSQLSRACENRPGAEPFLSDLRESGSLEQDADGVILLNRPEFFNHNLFKDRPTKGKGWIKVAKMRNGMTGDFTMDFDKKYAMWYNEAGSYVSREDYQLPEPAGAAPAPHSVGEDDHAPF